MVSTLGWIVIVALLSLTLMQMIYVWIYCRFLRSPVNFANPTEPNHPFIPKTAVIVCLRGADPSLPDCLDALLRQDHSDFEIHVVVDDENDPAMECVHRVLDGNGGTIIRTHVLDPGIASNCSLKCAALITAVGNLDSSFEVVALIDADTIADPRWLSDLIAPLADPTIGATTGNRWFAPADRTVGSSVRQIWNAAAVPQMSFYNVAWGGSLAIKLSTIQLCELTSAWSRAFCEDTMLMGMLKKQKLRVVRVPELIMLNCESTSLVDAYRWITRQLLTIRLHHPAWPMVLAHGLFAPCCAVSAVVLTVVLAALGNVWLAGGVAFTLFVYEIVNALLLQAIQNGNQAIIRRHRSGIPDVVPGLCWDWPGMLATQLVHPAAAITAALTRSVSWRGMTYSILRNNTVQTGPIKTGPYRSYREVIDSANETSTPDENSRSNSID